MLPQPLAERVLCGERLELTDQLAVTPKGQLRLDPELECRQADLLSRSAMAAWAKVS